MTDAVAHQIEWSGRWLFPLFHTSMQARNGRYGRDSDQQRQDWRRLRSFLKGLNLDSRIWLQDR
ncbi:MAG: hypothetical protein ABSH46_20615 [Bryobacteraceae bacterium]|jgi:hypothetical protein